MNPDIAARLDALLPQTQCTRCGFPTCRAYAEAIVRDEADIDRCPPGGADGVAALAALLGRAPKPLDPAYGTERPPLVARIDEEICIGCTKCIQACPVDAIVGAGKRMHTVIAAECTGCELCLPPCPVDCIVLVDIAPAPLARADVLARAAHARGRYLARSARLAGARKARTERAPRAAEPGASGPADRNAAAATDEPGARPIGRSSVLEAIARGKARRLAAKEPRA